MLMLLMAEGLSAYGGVRANPRQDFSSKDFTDNREEQPKMPGKGRPFQKGISGNPGGRPRQDPEVRALCEKFTPAAIATLAEIMGNKKAQPSARVAAAMAILKNWFWLLDNLKAG